MLNVLLLSTALFTWHLDPVSFQKQSAFSCSLLSHGVCILELTMGSEVLFLFLKVFNEEFQRKKRYNAQEGLKLTLCLMYPFEQLYFLNLCYFKLIIARRAYIFP